MKNTKYKIHNTIQITILSILAIWQSACTDDFEELNTLPTSITVVDPGLLITDVQKNVVFAEAGEGPNNIQRILLALF